ncbi:MAG: putative baseplate assembly protein [Clostridiales bacterium]|nr:putative baseplate assembly protein [Clostridiales bacterium]
MATKPPLMDDRGFEDIITGLKDNAEHYLPEWKPGYSTDPGVMLRHIFGRFMEIVIERLNRVPEKHKLAFLDAMGISPLPPVPAVSPLVFSLKKDAPPTTVPRGTALKAKSPEGGLPTLFETTEDLTVLPAAITRACTLEPERGRYGDYTGLLQGGGFTPFVGNRAFDDAYYFFDELALSLCGSYKTTVNLHMNTEKKSLNCGEACNFVNMVSWYYGDAEGTRAFTPILGEYLVSSPHDSVCSVIELILPDMEKLPIIEESPPLAGRQPTEYPAEHPAKRYIKFVLPESIWAKAMLAGIQISHIEINTKSPLITPEHLVFQNSRLDQNNYFLPFGNRPKEGDSFFIHMGELLSNPGFIVTVYIHANNAKIGKTVKWNDISYYYYTPNGWKNIKETENPYIEFVSLLTLRFTCPPDAAACKIGGIDGYWIRAVLPQDDYGKEPKYDKDGNLIAGTGYDPPVVRFVDAQSERPVICHTYRQTGHIYMQHSGPPFSPGNSIVTCANIFPDKYGYPELEKTAFYLGFDNFYPLLPVSFYADAEPSANDEGALEEAGYSWEYLSYGGWRPLYVKDDTAGLTRSGMVRFATPEDAEKKKLFDNTKHYWVRVSQGAGVCLRGIYLNAVTAQQAVTAGRELLGSSNGQGDQRFTLKGTPVLTGQRLWVREAEAPTAAELPQILVEKRQNPVTLETENWVLWQEQNSFGASLANSRHYILDRDGGEIKFGDGSHGMAPEKGAAIAVEYRFGGGQQGNLPVGAIAKLSAAIPGIERVSNPIAATGGAPSEDAAAILSRGPMALRHRGRGVTARDIEWLVKEAAGAAVDRIKCLKGGEGRAFTLMLVPAIEGLRPLPGGALAATVRQYLAGRIPAELAGENGIGIIGPRYITVDVSVSLMPKNPLEGSLVRERAVERLAEFLHPRRGGPQGLGWAFGRNVYLSEICELLEAVEGVERASASKVYIRPYADQREFSLGPSSDVFLETEYPVGSLLSACDDFGAVAERWRLAEAISSDRLPQKLRVTGLREGDILNICNVFKIGDMPVGDSLRFNGVDFPAGSTVRFDDGFTTTLAVDMPIYSLLTDDVLTDKHLTEYIEGYTAPKLPGGGVEELKERPEEPAKGLGLTVIHPDTLEITDMGQDGKASYWAKVRFLSAKFNMSPGIFVECARSKVRAVPVSEIEFYGDNIAVLHFSDCCDYFSAYSLSRPDGSKPVPVKVIEAANLTDIAYLQEDELCTPGDIQCAIVNT